MEKVITEKRKLGRPRKILPTPEETEVLVTKWKMETPDPRITVVDTAQDAETQVSRDDDNLPCPLWSIWHALCFGTGKVKCYQKCQDCALWKPQGCGLLRS